MAAAVMAVVIVPVVSAVTVAVVPPMVHSMMAIPAEDNAERRNCRVVGAVIRRAVTAISVAVIRCVVAAIAAVMMMVPMVLHVMRSSTVMNAVPRRVMRAAIMGVAVDRLSW